jgi:hypothetical protein
VSSRRTWSGGFVRPAATVDFTATLRLTGAADLVFGVRNAFDWRFEDPVYLAVDRMPRGRRAAWVKLAWRLCE